MYEHLSRTNVLLVGPLARLYLSYRLAISLISGSNKSGNGAPVHGYTRERRARPGHACASGETTAARQGWRKGETRAVSDKESGINAFWHCSSCLPSVFRRVGWACVRKGERPCRLMTMPISAGARGRERERENAGVTRCHCERHVPPRYKTRERPSAEA